MPQYNNPFTSVPVGWDDGDNGWGQPLNTTLLQYAFYHNRNVDGIITSPSSLPSSPLEGATYLSVSNVRVYYFSAGQWYNSLPPEGMKFRLKSSGRFYTRSGNEFSLDPLFANIATSGNAADLISGIIPSARLPAFTGDITKPQGSTVTTLANTGVVAGSYGLTTGLSFPRFTVDSKGRITSVVNQLIPNATTTVSGLMSGADKTKLSNLAVQVNSDWNSVSGFSQILNKPTLGTAAALNAQDNITDTTPNRLMRVGAGGLLGNTQDSSATGEFTVTRFFRAMASDPSIPFERNYHGLHINRNGELLAARLLMRDYGLNVLEGVGFQCRNGVGEWQSIAWAYTTANTSPSVQTLLAATDKVGIAVAVGSSGVYDTIAQAALVSLPVGAKYSTKGAVTVGDGGHGDFIVEAASGTPDGYSRVLLANGNHGVLQPVNGVVVPEQFGGLISKALAYAVSQNIPIVSNTDITVSIPSDTAEMQNVVDFLKVVGNHTVTINIESGHQLTSGINVVNGDYSYIEITSDDAEVLLASSFPRTDIIHGVNAKMPTLGCLIDANGLGAHGYHAEEVSTGTIRTGCGVIRCYRTACRAYSGSTIYANGGVFTEAAQIGTNESAILAWGARIFAEEANVSGSLYYGAQAAAGGILSFRQGIANNTGRYGIRATNGARVDARRVTVNGNARFGIFAYMSSQINAMGATANNNVEANIAAIAGSTVSFSFDEGSYSFCDGGGSTAQLYAARSSTIDAQGCTLTNGTNDAVYAESGSLINASVANISGYTRHGCWARDGRMVVNSTNIDGLGSTGNMLRSEAGFVSARAIKTTNSPSVPKPFFINSGGTMILTNNSTLNDSPIVAGDTNVVAGVNQIDGVRGIVYL